MRGAVYVNGKIMPADEAVVPVYDHGFLYGEGVYETLRTYNRVPFLFDRHQSRLRQSARRLGIDVPFDDATLLQRIHDTMDAALPARSERSGTFRSHATREPGGVQGTPPSSDEGYIRILLTRGVGELSYAVKATPTPSLAIIVKPLDPIPPAVFERGIRISLVDVMRNHPASVNPIIKSNNLLNNAIAMQQAHARGGEEALMCNYRGELAECSQSNVFLVRGGVVLTPPSEAGLLEGITRAFVFEIGQGAGLDVREQTLFPKDLDTADEAFITGTTREITPVVRVDERTIGRGSPGPITLKLLAEYHRRAQELTHAAV